MTTPTQITTESMKGCGARITFNPTKSSFAITDCGYRDTSNKVYLCPTCKKVNQTHKQDWEGELEKWNEGCSIIVEYGFGGYKCDGMKSHFCERCSKRITELTQALKILEGGK